MIKKALLLWIALAFVGCIGHTKDQSSQEEDLLFSKKELVNESLPPQNISLNPEPFLSQEADQMADLKLIAERESVQNWIRYFTRQDKERFTRFLNRGQIYRASIEKILEVNGLPANLFYVALIESGFRLTASSHAGAVGPWQFIRGTGRRFGLKINRYVDERSDPIRSTEAAARYLGALHKVFNSWFLSLAAYNSGESRVMNAILNYGTRDFWELCRLKALPPETREYVPKFLAAMIISSNPKFYNINLNKSEELDLVSIEVPSPISLSEVAKVSKIDLKVLRSLNPHLLRSMTSPFQNRAPIWFPRNISLDKEELLALKPNRQLAKQLQVGSEAQRFYHIKRGDTLYSVARRFSTAAKILRKINSLKNNRIYVGQKLKIPEIRSAG